MELQDAKWADLKNNNLESLFKSFVSKPTFPKADKVMQELNKTERPISPAVLESIHDFIKKKRGEGMEENAIREKVKDLWNITEF